MKSSENDIGKRAQVGLEYMFIIAITTVVVIALLGISGYYTREVEDSISESQLDAIGKDIIDKAESVYYFGEPSRIVINVFIPKGIDSITVNENELSFKFKTPGGQSDMFYKSNVPIQGSIQSSYGVHNVIIESREGHVWINGT